MADIEAVWPFSWLTDLGVLPSPHLPPAKFPRVAAWIARFRAAVAAGSDKHLEKAGAGAVHDCLWCRCDAPRHVSRLRRALGCF